MACLQTELMASLGWNCWNRFSSCFSSPFPRFSSPRGLPWFALFLKVDVKSSWSSLANSGQTFQFVCSDLCISLAFNFSKWPFTCFFFLLWLTNCTHFLTLFFLLKTGFNRWFISQPLWALINFPHLPVTQEWIIFLANISLPLTWQAWILYLSGRRMLRYRHRVWFKFCLYHI